MSERASEWGNHSSASASASNGALRPFRVGVRTEEDEGQHTDGPHVDRGPVSLATENLGRDVVGRATGRVQQRGTVCRTVQRGQPEVGDLEPRLAGWG